MNYVSHNRALLLASFDEYIGPASDGPHAQSTSAADFWAHVQKNCHTTLHPIAIGAIGKAVDLKLRVFGFQRPLSVMPSVVRGNTNAPHHHNPAKAAATRQSI